MNGIDSFHKNKNKTVQIKHQNWNTKEQTWLQGKLVKGVYTYEKIESIPKIALL